MSIFCSGDLKTYGLQKEPPNIQRSSVERNNESMFPPLFCDKQEMCLYCAV
ncbi:hypothetical protein DPMN_087579 [Dreissena polymorpha]|uniref:Uncharacterized protein n=1 Tax=Dreissena polymorpha TaxID=45954 RepID=A0A9D4KSY2_DREPO|nr:hypothetical protein DPMN_087579 [Dreissena polymorpha]